jgi:AAA+ ATPase superfamily predicted ATPase
MNRFFGRQRELRELNELIGQRAQLVVVYGRRRVGKTTLLLQWARQAARDTLYWVARRETADAVRQSFATALWKWAYPQSANPEPPRFSSWQLLFEQMERMIHGKPLIVILDEFPYAVESDPSLPSHLQAAWDHLFKTQPLTLVLAGSHIGMMVDLLNYQAPLYGRVTAQMAVEPLPFAVLQDFFPGYTAAERVATYATVGGVPAYLERFEPQLEFSANIRRHLFRRTGMFHSEPVVLISDLVRETRTYEAVLRAIAAGRHTPAEIAQMTGVASPNLPAYLRRLRALGLVERRIPATVRPEQRQATTRSRYHLRDPYLRFYFRFIEPNLEMIEQELYDLLWERIGEQFRAFVGATVFEDLCREWLLVQARRRQLPFMPELVGSHWAPAAQVDVVAINWREQAILLGECKWGAERVGRAVITELINKAPQVAPGTDWNVYYAYFARAGFTDAALNEAASVNAQLIDLAQLDADLRRALP